MGMMTTVIMDTVFISLFLIFFYQSVKKCFWKGDIKKSKLILKCILNNPIIIYLLSLFLSSVIVLLPFTLS